ncbi:MAG TPA: type II toxin-antitoxin system ParD family antitoxin [Desulfomicrobiaceae bacterium]|nr:type II toxin-antitoxin system ParD family antitoxin [Desulfomicrobiaceae bacterium]
MPTRNVVLTDHQSIFVEELVKSGRYQNASEVLREGLRLIEQRELEASERLKALREAVALGVSDIDAGRCTTLENRAEVQDHMRNLARQARENL